MLEKDQINIYYKQAIINLFVFKEKVKTSKTIEEWDAKTFSEQVQEFKDMIEYSEHMWLKYRFLADITKWITITSPFILLLIFGLTVNFLIYTPIIVISIYLVNRTLERSAAIKMMLARMDWFFLQHILNESFRP